MFLFWFFSEQKTFLKHRSKLFSIENFKLHINTHPFNIERIGNLKRSGKISFNCYSCCSMCRVWCNFDGISVSWWRHSEKCYSNQKLEVARRPTKAHLAVYQNSPNVEFEPRLRLRSNSCIDDSTCEQILS